MIQDSENSPSPTSDCALRREKTKRKNKSQTLPAKATNVRFNYSSSCEYGTVHGQLKC